MGIVKFPLPEDMHETVGLINTSDLWNLSLDEYDGAIDLIFGDQLRFVAETREEARAFLAGFFLVTFSGRDLFTIKQELARDRQEQGR